MARMTDAFPTSAHRQAPRDYLQLFASQPHRNVFCVHVYPMITVTTDALATCVHRRSGPRTLASLRRLHGTRGFRLTWYCGTKFPPDCCS